MAMHPIDANARPHVGMPYAVNGGPEIIIPTYVRLSEAPMSDGGCITADLADPAQFRPAGWYVEYRYPDSSEQYRRFIPFPA